MVIKYLFSALFKAIKLVINLIAITAVVILIGFAIYAYYFYNKVDNYDSQEPKGLSPLILEITPSALNERTTLSGGDSPLLNYLSNNKEVIKAGLFRVVRQLNSELENKKTTPIKGIFINLGSQRISGYAAINELGTAIKEFKEQTGIPVVTYGTSLSLFNLYLASFSDQILTSYDPLFSVRQYNLGEVYHKDFFAKYGVEVQSHRQGKYKSALEYQFENDITPAYKEGVIDFYINHIQNDLVNEIAQALNIKDPEFILPNDQKLIANLKEYGSEVASLAHHKVITKQLGTGELSNYLKGVFGKSALNKNNQLNIVSIDDFILERLRETKKSEKEAKEAKDKKLEAARKEALDKDEEFVEPKAEDEPLHIAVYTLTGGVVTSGNPDSAIVSDSLVPSLEKLDNKKVAGVLIRVNSGGGSSIAGSKIAAAIDYVSKVKKIPVVISQGSVAASAAYHISSPGNFIYANPKSIVGSIGTYIDYLNAKNSLKQIYSINQQTYGEEPFAGAYYYFPLLGIKAGTGNIATEKTYIHSVIESGYYDFVSSVAKYRKLSFDQVNKYAQGRVWTGVEGYEYRLNDDIGSINDAYEKLLQLAKKEKPDLDLSKVQYKEYNAIYEDHGKFEFSQNPLVSYLQQWLAAYAISQQLGITHSQAFDLVSQQLPVVKHDLSTIDDSYKNFKDHEVLELCTLCVEMAGAK